MVFTFGQLKPLALGAMLAVGASASAFAADVTLALPGSMQLGSGSLTASGGSMTLSLGSEFLGVLDTVRANVLKAGTQSSPVVMHDIDGFLTRVDMSAPIASLTVDADKHMVTGVSTAVSGLGTITTLPRKSISSGGQITISDLSVDLHSKVVSATLIGGNGVGTLTNIPFMQAQSADLHWSPCADGSACADTNPSTNSYRLQVNLSSLIFIPSGNAPFVKGLGLLSLGRAAFQSLQYSDYQEYGIDIAALSFNVDVHLSKDMYISPNGAIVPEPELVTMAAAGLLVAGATLRRRSRKHTGHQA